VYRTGIIAGIVVGASLIAFGAILTVLGLSGSIEWLLKVEGLESRLVNASPGVLFAIAGVLVVIVYKPRVKTVLHVLTEQSPSEPQKGDAAKTAVRQEFYGGSER